MHCLNCGGVLIGISKKFCCVECKTEHNSKNKKEARHALTELDPNKNCLWCGKPTDRRTKWPHDKYPVLDHITPLAKGGTHTRRNVQCAHNKCNSLKQADMIGQMRLID